MSAASTIPLTLYEDWRQRRAQLREESAPSGEAAFMARVLDYLLRRYRDSAEAQAVVCAPQAVEVNERALIVHRHLGRTPAARVSSSRTAERRIQGVLARMTSPTQTEANWQAESPLARVEEPWLDEARLSLASTDGASRMDALRILWRWGSLRDVALLCDLLALPESSEHPQERTTLRWTLEQLAGIAHAGDTPPWFTLCTDWVRRRTVLDRFVDRGNEPVDAMAAVLDFLLLHHCAAPEAAQLAVVVPRALGPDPRGAIVNSYISGQSTCDVWPFQTAEEWLDNVWRRNLIPRECPPAELSYWADMLRSGLAHPDHAAFRRSLHLLPHVGNLHDISLLCDLLLSSAVSLFDDRLQMVAVMRRLAGMPDEASPHRGAPAA